MKNMEGGKNKEERGMRYEEGVRMKEKEERGGGVIRKRE